MLFVFGFAHLGVTCVTAEVRKCGNVEFSGNLHNEDKHYFGRCQPWSAIFKNSLPSSAGIRHVARRKKSATEPIDIGSAAQFSEPYTRAAPRLVVHARSAHLAMDVLALVLMLVLRPFRMMLLHPRMVVPNPPIAIMPRVMVVVVTNDWWSSIYVGRRAAVRISGARTISVGVRPVPRLIRMPTVKTRLERERSDHENHCLQGRENFTCQLAGHGRIPQPKRAASRMPAGEAGESHGFAKSRERG
jgi:hypothetical protein